MTAVTFFSGLILFTLGAIGQYIARIFEQMKDRPIYIVDEVLGDADADRATVVRLTVGARRD